MALLHLQNIIFLLSNPIVQYCQSHLCFLGHECQPLYLPSTFKVDLFETSQYLGFDLPFIFLFYRNELKSSQLFSPPLSVRSKTFQEVFMRLNTMTIFIFFFCTIVQLSCFGQVTFIGLQEKIRWKFQNFLGDFECVEGCTRCKEVQNAIDQQYKKKPLINWYVQDIQMISFTQMVLKYKIDRIGYKKIIEATDVQKEKKAVKQVKKEKNDYEKCKRENNCKQIETNMIKQKSEQILRRQQRINEQCLQNIFVIDLYIY